MDRDNRTGKLTSYNAAKAEVLWHHWSRTSLATCKASEFFPTNGTRKLTYVNPATFA